MALICDFSNDSGLNFVGAYHRIAELRGDPKDHRSFRVRVDTYPSRAYREAGAPPVARTMCYVRPDMKGKDLMASCYEQLKKHDAFKDAQDVIGDEGELVVVPKQRARKDDDRPKGESK